MYKVDNAVIMAAGVSSRFAPLSYEIPKALTEVRGEILIERQIQQLHNAGIFDIYVIVGYKAELFSYLVDKYDVTLIMNHEFLSRNNHSSIFVAKEIIKNTYICSADNYFVENPFEATVEDSYYAAVFSDKYTPEWCMHADDRGIISQVSIGGSNAWYMLGHSFWSEEFSTTFLKFLTSEYFCEETKPLFWENIFINHLDSLKMKIRKYPSGFIYEFDSIDELRDFDTTYVYNTRSKILKEIACILDGEEREISNITAVKENSTLVSGIRFTFRGNYYTYTYSNKQLRSEYA